MKQHDLDMDYNPIQMPRHFQDGKKLVSHEVIHWKYVKALFSWALKIRTVMKNLLTAMKQRF